MTNFEKKLRNISCKTLLKKAQEAVDEEKKVDYTSRRRRVKLLLGAIIGGLSGAVKGSVVGAAMDPDKWKMYTAAGAGIGSAAGLGMAHLDNKVRGYFGLDPFGQVVTVPKA